ERADLPVEDGAHVALRADDAVVEPVVAVDDRGVDLLGQVLDEVVVDLVDRRELAGLRVVPLAVPALQLPGEVALPPAEVAEADGVDVDVVDRDERVDEVLAGVAALLLVELLADLGGADDEPV